MAITRASPTFEWGNDRNRTKSFASCKIWLLKKPLDHSPCMSSGYVHHEKKTNVRGQLK